MLNFKQSAILYVIPWISLLTGWFLGLLSGDKSEIFGAWFLLASALFFGLPHGGYDFWILLNSSKKHKFGSLIGKLILYVAITIGFIGVWYFKPSAALIIFIGLSVWHFGSGDAVWEATNRFDWFLKSCGRGLLILFAPLTFHPIESSEVFTKLDVNTTQNMISIAPFALTAGIILLLLSIALQFIQKDFLIDKIQIFTWFEIIFLIAFFRQTTPVLAVAIYFVGVHSWRHFMRINLYESNSNILKMNDLWQSIKQFHQKTLPLTIISLIGTLVIFGFFKFKVSDLADQTSNYLILLSALTVPHAVLITWTEFNQKRIQF